MDVKQRAIEATKFMNKKVSHRHYNRPLLVEARMIESTDNPVDLMGSDEDEVRSTGSGKNQILLQPHEPKMPLIDKSKVHIPKHGLVVKQGKH